MATDPSELRSTLTRAILETLHETRARLPEACDRIGLPEAPDDPRLTKQEYIRSRLPREAGAIRRVSESFVTLHPWREGRWVSYDLEEFLWSEGKKRRVPKKTRQEIAEKLFGSPLLVPDGGRLYAILSAHWPTRRNELEALILGQRTYEDAYLQHVVRNEDWSIEDIFDQLGAFECSSRRFENFLEALVHPTAFRHEEESRRLDFVKQVNEVLAKCDRVLRVADDEAGYQVFRIGSASQGGVPGAPKNLIFASIGRKPDIKISDAINNDLIVLQGDGDVLVYDLPILDTGLTWGALIDWWAAKRGVPVTKEAGRELLKRLRASLAKDSPPEALVFDTYWRTFRSVSKDQLPALVPQVYLHYDPVLRSQRGSSPITRERMDFLLLLPQRVRIVIEVDGKHHYARKGSNEQWTADPSGYASMAAEDRRLRLKGYEVYRFGGAELRDSGPVVSFFRALAEKHGFGS